MLCVGPVRHRGIYFGTALLQRKFGAELIKPPALPEPANEFLNLVWEVVDSCTNVNWVFFVVTAWSLWNDRNSVIHGGNSKGKEGLIKSVVGYVEEIKSEKTTQRGVHSGVAQKWTPPKQG